MSLSGDKLHYNLNMALYQLQSYQSNTDLSNPSFA